MQFGPLEAMPTPVELPAWMIATCETYRDAIKLCMDESLTKRTRSTWASLLGMKEGSLSNILNFNSETSDPTRKRTFDPELFDVLQRMSGNAAIDQFFTMQRQGKLNSQRSVNNRIQELKNELQELEAKAG